MLCLNSNLGLVVSAILVLFHETRTNKTRLNMEEHRKREAVLGVSYAINSEEIHGMKIGIMFFALLLLLSMSGSGFAQDRLADPDPEAINKLAFAALKSGDYNQAAEYFAQAADLGANPANNYFNAACAYSLNNETDNGLAMLNKAIDAGYRNYTNMSNDADLSNLRSDPGFTAALDRISEFRVVVTDNLKRSADQAEFVFDDIYNFLHALELIKKGADTVTTIEAEYFAKATPGLKQMVIKYPFSAEDLASAMAKYPDSYENLSEKVSLLQERIPEFRVAFGRFQTLYPDIIFPPTYFVVDGHRGIGSGSPDGQLIGLERKTEKSIMGLETLLVHELTHFQQLYVTGPDQFYAVFGYKKTLLNLTIREGAAEFVAQRVTGSITQRAAAEYAAQHESELWERFQKEMKSSDLGDWMWSKPSDPDQPKDLAYGLGALIVETYYENAADKAQAIKEILSVIDYDSFLRNSAYSGRSVPR